MKNSKNIKLIILIIGLVCTCISLGLLFNSLFFHKDAIEGTEGHYEPKVYITPTGECYHQGSCIYIKTMREIGLYQAQNKGYRACSHCGGVSSSTIWINGITEEPEENNYLLSHIIAFLLTSPFYIYWFLQIKNN